jgi:hypothetical protein
VIPDIPITVIFLVIYLTFGIVHLKILKSNKGRGHKFIFNGALMGISQSPNLYLTVTDNDQVSVRFE